MYFKKALYILTILAFVTSCKNKTTPDNLYKFKTYISHATSGRVSIIQPIVVVLNKEVDSWIANEALSDASLLDISPKIDGKLISVNKRQLSFFPSEDLKSDTEYTVTLKLKNLFKNLPSEFKSYTFKFKTFKQNLNIQTNNLQSYDTNWQHLDGTIKLADVSTLDKAKTLINASQKNKPLVIKWDESYQKAKVFSFKIDSIKRYNSDSKININWNGQNIGANNKGDKSITIPGVNNFTVINVEVKQSPEQHLSINFSDPLKKQQNFAGLITLGNTKQPRFVVDGNILKVYPKTRIVGSATLNVFEGIKNTSNFKLQNSFSQNIAFEQLKPNIRLITNSGILPNSQNLKFNFEAVNLKAVDVRIIKVFEDNVLQFLQDNTINSNNANQIKRVGRRIAKKTIPLIKDETENTGRWKAYSIDLSNYFNADKGAIYRVELSYNINYALYNCNANTTSQNDNDADDYYDDDYYYDDENSLPDGSSITDNELREQAYWDNVVYNYKNYTYDWYERNNPCNEAYYNENKIVSSNLIASNLGVIAKRGHNNSYYFAVNDILTTIPQANVTIDIFNYQQQLITSTTTNNEGLAIIDADSHAAFAIATKEDNITYIKLNDGNALSLSKFNVSGKTLQRGLKGYIYGDRGVWRPGDTIHLTFILNDNANKLPSNHPVKLELTDANGKLVYQNVSKNGLNNFYNFNIPTKPEDKTGRWNATITVGGATFHKALKVETIKPNRLKIKLDFEQNVLSNNTPLNSKLQVNWLHGAAAKHIKTEVKAKITTNSNGFKNYPKYSFTDPTRKFKTEDLTIFEGETNAEGSAYITKTLNIGKNAPGLLNVSFLTRAFENGGDFSIDAFNKPFAPYTSFVGLRSPKTKAYNSYDTDKNHEFDVVVVNAQGKPIKRKNLNVKVYQIKWRWWWNSGDDDLASYQSSSYRKAFLTKTISTDSNGKTSFNINIPEEESGRYLIKITDPVSGHATGTTTYFYSNWWSRKSTTENKEAAKMLVFSSDKDTYNVGETAKITFPSGTEGHALISIENGTEVIETMWVKTQKGETVADIPITKQMTPNVFVSISLLQPHAATENDLPIRLYGVIPIMVENQNTKLNPVLNIPKVLRPEKDVTFSVSEQNKKAMTYTVALVDEGLLDLTRFKTPNAWNEFYTREALGVKTWDIYDEVIGAYTGNVDQVFEIGGDASASAAKNKKANRFKPVVKYLGPFSLNAGETKSHTIKLPKYIGAIRTMVVAGDLTTNAYGSTDQTTTVKEPLMVLATLPRKLSPGEKVTLPVTVFAMSQKVKNVNLTLKLSKGITIIGDKTKQLNFSKPDEKMAYFNLDVSKANGINTVEVIAKSNGESSSYKVELDVFNPNPITTKVTDLVIEKGIEKTIDFSTFGVSNSNSAMVEFSTLPTMNFNGRLKYLIQYPHGCVEQTTSSVFPQLFLSDIFDLDSTTKQNMTNNIKKGIERLNQFQTNSGGLSYWPGGNSANDWGTSYAGHFMIEAEKKGFILPLTFMSNWLNYQKEAARDWRPGYRYNNNDVAQSYRLYTLALAGQPDLASMNRLKAYSKISNDAKWRLAAAYALAGHKEAAKNMASKSNIDFTSNTYDYYTYGSVDRNRAMALETMILIDDLKTRETAEYIAKRLSSKQWMSTQTTAYSLLAMSKMVQKNGGKAINLTYRLNHKKPQTLNSQKAIANRELNIHENTNTISVNSTNNTVYARIITSGKLPLGSELTEKRGLNVSVIYKNSKGKPIDISTLQQGQDFVASITVTNLKKERINDVALTQIFPSGWEIVNTRFTAFGNGVNATADYTDIRDDRVNFYFDLDKNKSKTFSVQLNAAYLGYYYLPGTQAEAMYDNTYFVHTKGQWVNIEK